MKSRKKVWVPRFTVEVKYGSAQRWRKMAWCGAQRDSKWRTSQSQIGGNKVLRRLAPLTVPALPSPPSLRARRANLYFPDAGRIVAIQDRTQAGTAFEPTFGTYEELVARNRSFETLSATDIWRPSLTGTDEPERLEGQRVTAALLRLFVTNPSGEGGMLTAAPDGWSEATLSWDDAPGVGALVLDTAGLVFPDSWVEFDVSELVTGPGTYDFGLSSSSSNGVTYSSREGDYPPELVVFTAPVVPTAGPLATAFLGCTLAAIGSRLLSRRAPR
jgi:hypothetical protein